MKYPLISRNGVFAVLLLALGINFGAGRLPGASIDPSRLPASGWAGQVGIPGGIPTNYTQFCNVTQSIPGYSGALADPTGVADSSPAINFAIQHCPNNQYVYIPTGNYHIGSQLSRQGINNFDNIQHPFSIEVKGDGPALTKLFYYGTSGHIFSFHPANGSTSGTTAITSGNTRGSTSITLASVNPYIQMPMALVINRLNNEAITLGTNGGVDPAYEINTCSQIVEITGINRTTNTITFSPALNEGYPSDYIAFAISQPYRCGIQDLYIENKVNQGSDNINIDSGQECWIKNVESAYASAYHVRLQSCVRCEVRESYFHNAWWAGGNEGYGVDLNTWSSNNLVENNSFLLLRHAMPMEVGGQGNVYGYNYNSDPVNSDNTITYTVANATNASPIVVTTTVPNDLVTGTQVTIAGVLGNTSANVSGGIVTVIDSTHFSINGTTGSGAYTGGGSFLFYGLQVEQATTYLMGDELNHGGEPRWNLREGNVAATIKFDCVLGGSAYDTVFRNQIQRKGLSSQIVANFGSDIQQWNYFHNLSGNVYEAPPIGFAGPARRFGTDQDSSSSWSISNASGSPIVVTTSSANTLRNGDFVTITGVVGNTAANVLSRLITVTDSTHFTITGVNSSGTYTSGGLVGYGTDPNSQPTTLIDGEYVFGSSGIVWAGADHTLPTSYYLTSTPAWFGNLNFPAVDPTNPVASGTTLIPAGFLRANGTPPPTAPYILLQPVATGIASGGTTSFSIEVDGYAAPTLVWNYSPDGGTTWLLVSGLSSALGTPTVVTTTPSAIDNLSTLTIANAGVGANGYLFECVATNSQGTITTNAVALTVSPPPVVTSATAATATQGQVFSYTITATNTPVSYSATGLPAGLTVNTATGVISGTPTVNGSFSVSIDASNLVGPGTAVTLALTINPPQPVISSASATTTQGTTFLYTIVATNSPTLYGATGLPAGLTVNTATGIISGIPTVNGSFSIGLNASNVSGGGTPGTLSLTIRPPAPVITGGAASGTQGVAFTYSITASFSPTAYTASGLPAGLTLNTSTGAITGTPTVYGSFTVTLGASNITGSATPATLALTIIPPGPPVLTSASVVGYQGVAFSYQIIASLSPTSYSATGLPTGLSVNTTTGVIGGTPTVIASTPVTVSAINAFGAAVSSGTVTINVTLLPPPVITSAPAASAALGAPFGYIITATNSPTSFSATNLPAGFSVNTSSGLISGIATTAGPTTIALSATNPTGTGTGQLVLNVTQPNPVITSANSAGAGLSAPFTYAITATNSPTSFNATNLPAGLSVNKITGVISGTPTATGTFTVTLTASNAGGGVGTATLALVVTNRAFSGVYFGTFAGGGNWALYVLPNNTGTFVAYIGSSSTPVVQSVTINPDGTFSVSAGSVASGARFGLNANVSFTISGTISGGAVTGAAGSIALTGAQDGTSSTGLFGLYSSTALGTAGGTSTAIIGASGAILVLSVSGTVADVSTGTISSSGTYTGTTSDGGHVSLTISSSGTVNATLTNAAGTQLSFFGTSPAVAAVTRLTNLSARAVSGTGSNILTVGFIVSGGSKVMLLRGVGPTLTAYGLTGVLAAPQLALFSGSTVLQSNSSWGGSSSLSALFSQVSAFTLPTTSNDDALQTVLPAGAYTSQVGGAAGATGLALAEIYDADTGTPTGRLTNISARAQVGTGSNILTAGLIISGNAPEIVLIRAVGPTLSTFGITGVLATPQLTLFDSNGNALYSNSGWGGTTTLTNTFTKVGAFPLPSTSADAALLVTLAPGAYTAQVTGLNGTTGVALVEVYESN